MTKTFKIKKIKRQVPVKRVNDVILINDSILEYYHGKDQINPDSYEFDGKYGKYILRSGISGNGNDIYTMAFIKNTENYPSVHTTFGSVKEMFAYLNA